MDSQLYLILPETAGAAFKPVLMAALNKAEAAALLLPRGGRDDASYQAAIAALLPVAQGAGAAFLIEGDAALARATGADGLHLTGGIGEVKAAIAALKPDMIVGVGDIGSRHAAMSFGELDIDYLMFGEDGDEDGAERALWWAETFEVPSVLVAAEETAGPTPCEFVAPAPAIWDQPADAPARLAAFVKKVSA